MLEDDDTIVLQGPVERWRLACPLGHRGTGIVPREEYWYCETCQKRGIDSEYSYVTDRKSGQFLSPDEVEVRRSSRTRIGEATND